MSSDSVRSLAEALLGEVRHSRNRRIVGITGPPGAGKSTLTAALVKVCQAELGNSAVAGLPMDGFHRPNRALVELGRERRKGAPDTFEAGAFVAAVRRLSQGESQTLTWPAYSHRIREPVADAIRIPGSIRLAFIEGNYLLLQEEPWNQIRAIACPIWYLDADSQTTKARLLRRQLGAGRSRKDALRHVDESDMLNAMLVERTKQFADRVVQLDSSDPLLIGLHDSATGDPIILDAEVEGR